MSIRAFLKRRWPELAILLALTVVCLCWWRLSAAGDPGIYALVTWNGERVLEIPLDRDGFYVLDQDPTVRFEVKNGAVAFVDATCPDRICEREGFLSKAGQTAVCLPRKTSLVIVGAGGEETPDVIAR